MYLLILLLVIFSLFPSSPAGAGANPYEAQIAEAAADPTFAVKLEKHRWFLIVKVEEIKNGECCTNAHPPILKVSLVRALRGTPTFKSFDVKWLPFPQGTVDTFCDEKCYNRMSKDWENYKLQAPTPGEKFVVCGTFSEGTFIAPAHCRYSATPGNIKKVEAALNGDHA